MIQVLSTKELDEETIAYGQSLNFDITCVNFIEIVSVAWNENFLSEHEYESVAFTSSSAVKYFLENRYAAEWIKTKNVFSITGKTREELEKRRIEVLINAEDSASLTQEVCNRKLTGSVLHVCGNIRLNTLEKMLFDADIKYYPLVVYNTKLITGLHLQKEFDALLFYSPSGVEGFLSANKIDSKTICCCIGNTTASKLRGNISNAKIVVSPFPSPKSMLERVASYFDKA